MTSPSSPSSPRSPSPPSSAGAGEPGIVHVVPMRPRHVPEVVAIEAQVYPRPWSERLFRDELSRPGRAYVVARSGHEVVGYAGLLMIADDGHVATVAVRPDWQRRGVGRHLVRAVVERAREMGANQLTLEVRASNRGAQRLYREFGFAPAGARKAYYADNGEDALVMWAHDVAAPAYGDRLAALARSGSTEAVVLPAGSAVDAPRVGAPQVDGPAGHPTASQERS